MDDNNSKTSKLEEQFQTFNKEQAWQKVFLLLNKSSYEQNFSNKTTVAKKQSNAKLNRYSDVIPYDESRIKLKNLDNDYINASLVKVDKAERSYILTQGPLKNTVGHFWLMIWQKNSACIIMLNKLIENGCDKCYGYWPSSKENKLNLGEVGLEVELINEREDDENNDFIIREFKLRHLESGVDRTVLHFHFISWPDFGTPNSPASFVNFLYTVRESGYLNSNKYGPSVVHCSAGIGRSGTFILVDSFINILNSSTEKDKEPDVLELLMKMRSYRLGLVQTFQQLRFAYQAIINAKSSSRFKPVKEVKEDENLKKKNNENLVNNLLIDNQYDKLEEESKEREVRRRIREEKKKNLMDNITRIKSKQKEIENWNQKKLLLKNAAIIFGIGALVVGLYYKTIY